MHDVRRLFTGSFLIVFMVAVLAQILLGYFAPDPKGYAYDFYPRAIQVIFDKNRLPNVTDCWICYHPPLFPVMGAVIYKFVFTFGGGAQAQIYGLSIALSFLSLVMSVYAFLIYQLYRKHAKLDLLIWALLLFLPVRFIASFSAEADILAATLIVMATYYFALYLRHDSMRMLLVAAVVVGLATLAKYNGIVVFGFFGLVLLGRFLLRRNWRRFNHGLVFGLVVFAIGGWLYVSNVVKYENPFPGNAAWNTGKRYLDHYDFTSFGLGRIVATYYNSSPGKPGELWRFPAFNSEVLTSHYGQLWTDFSFFSVANRHGMHEFRLFFTGKSVPIPLIWLLLIAGLVPVAYSLLGFALSLWQREALFITGLFVVTIAAYLNWFTGYHIWMLKTKYLLYLLPMWLFYISKVADLIGPRAVIWTVSPAVILSAIYCFVFAIG